MRGQLVYHQIDLLGTLLALHSVQAKNLHRKRKSDMAPRNRRDQLDTHLLQLFIGLCKDTVEYPGFFFQHSIHHIYRTATPITVLSNSILTPSTQVIAMFSIPPLQFNHNSNSFVSPSYAHKIQTLL